MKRMRLSGTPRIVGRSSGALRNTMEPFTELRVTMTLFHWCAITRLSNKLQPTSTIPMQSPNKRALTSRDPRVPAWEEVKDKKWEANRMATYAAMVVRMDTGIGRILETLKKTGVETNTLVLFFSDNGACEEVIHPAWYDVPSRTRDGRPVKVGNQDHAAFAGPDDVWQSYGPQWANVGDTPFRLY